MRRTFTHWSRQRLVARLEFAHKRWPPAVDKGRRVTMKNPLDSLWGTIISGLVLTAILYYIVRSMLI